MSPDPQALETTTANELPLFSYWSLSITPRTKLVAPVGTVTVLFEPMMNICIRTGVEVFPPGGGTVEVGPTNAPISAANGAVKVENPFWHPPNEVLIPLHRNHRGKPGSGPPRSRTTRSLVLTRRCSVGRKITTTAGDLPSLDVN
jgi:hypothetical protein